MKNKRSTFLSVWRREIKSINDWTWDRRLPKEAKNALGRLGGRGDIKKELNNIRDEIISKTEEGITCCKNVIKCKKPEKALNKLHSLGVLDKTIVDVKKTIPVCTYRLDRLKNELQELRNISLIDVIASHLVHVLWTPDKSWIVIKNLPDENSARRLRLKKKKLSIVKNLRQSASNIEKYVIPFYDYVGDGQLILNTNGCNSWKGEGMREYETLSKQLNSLADRIAAEKFEFRKHPGKPRTEVAAAMRILTSLFITWLGKPKYSLVTKILSTLLNDQIRLNTVKRIIRYRSKIKISNK